MVATGPSPKAVALKAAIDMKATWVILDRSIKSKPLCESLVILQ